MMSNKEVKEGNEAKHFLQSHKKWKKRTIQAS